MKNHRKSRNIMISQKIKKIIDIIELKDIQVFLQRYVVCSGYEVA